MDQVIGLVMGVGAHYQTIADIAQNIFLNVWRRRVRIAATVRDFDAYLFMMTRNEALNYLSRSRQPYEDLPEDLPAYAAEDVQLSVEARDLQRRVAAAVEQLPPQQRRVFELSRIRHLSYQEIAQEMDISPKTVENHLSRALKDIKKTLS